MSSARDILQFFVSTASMRQSKEVIIPSSLETRIEQSLFRLKKLTKDLGENAFIVKVSYNIPAVYLKFKQHAKDPRVNFDRRELRTLTYSLGYSEDEQTAILDDEIDVERLLRLLEAKWKDSCLVGLTYSLLRHWNASDKRSIAKLEEFILDRLRSYEGNRRTVVILKQNARFLHSNSGDLALGDTIAKVDKPIYEAANLLSFPDSWLSYPYFSRVILSYYERAKLRIGDILDPIDKALAQHNNDATNKKVLSLIIIQANSAEFVGLQDRIKSVALQRIGDPEESQKWMPFKNATEQEKSNLNEARRILGEWITRQFISVFFNVCINDPRRKQFWLSMASKISSFEVCGPRHIKAMLKRNERIADIVERRYKTVLSNQNVAAMILYVGKYMLIEFSNEGFAFYTYKLEGAHCPKITSSLRSVEDLRNSSMQMATHSDSQYIYFRDEGRLTHRDGNELWEDRFTRWMNKKVFAS